MPNCEFCGAEMVLAWNGETPWHNSLLAAYICPKCYSTRYVCSNTEDPMFKILTEIQKAFMEVWRKQK